MTVAELTRKLIELEARDDGTGDLDVTIKISGRDPYPVLGMVINGDGPSLQLF